jgi:hypothetical protein
MISFARASAFWQCLLVGHHWGDCYRFVDARDPHSVLRKGRRCVDCHEIVMDDGLPEGA